MRAIQPHGQRGSLKWIQRAIEQRDPALEAPILEHLRGARRIDWRSPLRDDDFAEYRDADFLRLLGLDHLTSDLAAFWPERGPQWDALAITDGGHVLLIEAKAHIAEFCSPGSQAGSASSSRIAQSLEQVAIALGSKRGGLWPDLFYQYANRIAHLHLLCAAGVDAHLVLVSFLNDRDMKGPTSPEAWRAAYHVADHALDLGARHPLSSRILHVFPDVAHG